MTNDSQHPAEKLLTEPSKIIMTVYQGYLERQKQVEKEFEEEYEREMGNIRKAIEQCPALSKEEREFLMVLTHKVQIFIAPHFPYDRAEWKMAHSPALQRFLRIDDILPKGITMGKHVSLLARPVTWRNS